jgi:surfeit locus 1 family protein
MTPEFFPLRISFRPPWWALLLAASGCAAGIALGNWQWGRAAEKRAIAESRMPVTLHGNLEPKYTIFLDNKLHRGRPGYQVVQPILLAGGKHVLVNRGWVAMKEGRELLPAIQTPPGEVTLEGFRLDRFARAFAPSGARPAGQVWQNVSIQDFAAWSGLELEAWVFEQHSALDDGLAREWPRAHAAHEKNEMYALQWYSLAALSIALLLILNVKREKHRS